MLANAITVLFFSTKQRHVRVRRTCIVTIIRQLDSKRTIVPLCSARLHNALYPLEPSFSLTLLHVFSAPLHGLANAFVFGLDRNWWSLLSPTSMQVCERRGASFCFYLIFFLFFCLGFTIVDALGLRFQGHFVSMHRTFGNGPKCITTNLSEHAHLVPYLFSPVLSSTLIAI